METTTNKQNLIRAGIVLVVILSLYALVLVVKEWKSLKYIDGSSNITVTGEGDVVAVPDIATFSYSVTEVAKTVNEARDQATAITNKALEVIKKSGVNEKDVKTIGYSISPKYEYTGGTAYVPSRQIFTGYEVSQNIEVKVRDLNKVGKLFTDVSSVGVKNLSGINFAVESQEMLKQEARNEAIKKAKVKADDLADALGVKIVRVTSFNESGNTPYPMYYAKGGVTMDTAMASAPSPSVPAGEQKITSTVSITYEIR